MVRIHGLFNFACTITSIIILILPIHYLRRCFRQPEKSKQPIILEQKLYSMSLLALFTFNLYEHATGYTGPPSIQTFGIVNNIMLSTLLYRIWHCQKKTEGLAMLKLCPTRVTFLLGTLSIVLLFIGFVVGINWEDNILKVISPPVNIYVIFSTGRLSWIHDKNHDHCGVDAKKEQFQKTGNTIYLFKLWRLACVFLILVGVGTETESKLCDYFNSRHRGNLHLSRIYHPIYLHLIITLLYYFVSECAFQLVERAFICQVSERKTNIKEL